MRTGRRVSVVTCASGDWLSTPCTRPGIDQPKDRAHATTLRLSDIRPSMRVDIGDKGRRR